MFGESWRREEEKVHFFDADPTIFAAILNAMRRGHPADEVFKPVNKTTAAWERELDNWGIVAPQPTASATISHKARRTRDCARLGGSPVQAKGRQTIRGQTGDAVLRSAVDDLYAARQHLWVEEVEELQGKEQKPES
ncbi:uncharacterized protein ACA1_134100 [Acanthamoeba castellanii str. Neff]|uniref:Uncharacterized protein n=1 Tax=Acanthamoeba castellanii (strain ATCC 30010 / Neff) TaxID=1257118 RepID=L8GEQ0_ACACF|nr:uncharacterized protein ACA1_134100 [Acanthamoeba castellanii str. Neff]ELR11354.1 hypothetical protein ACA1_134100 [Acanthamoeba castellanii str. Neff]